jgi:hypothetical protein
MRLGMNDWHLRIMVQGFIEHYEVWSWAMVVELNQYYNSKNRTNDLDMFHFTQITQLIFEYMWDRQSRLW